MKFNLSAKLKKQRGNIMVEYGLYFLLAAVALAGLIAYYVNNNASVNANGLSSDMMALMSKVKTNYANNFAGVTNAKLSTGGFFSGMNSMSDTSGTVTLNIGGGGTLTVSPGTVVSANDSISYVLTNIPDSACLPLASTLARNVTKMLVGSNVVKAVGGAPDSSKVQCTGNTNTFTLLQQ